MGLVDRDLLSTNGSYFCYYILARVYKGNYFLIPRPPKHLFIQSCLPLGKGSHAPYIASLSYERGNIFYPELADISTLLPGFFHIHKGNIGGFLARCLLGREVAPPGTRRSTSPSRHWEEDGEGGGKAWGEGTERGIVNSETLQGCASASKRTFALSGFNFNGCILKVRGRDKKEYETLLFIVTHGTLGLALDERGRGEQFIVAQRVKTCT